MGHIKEHVLAVGGWLAYCANHITRFGASYHERVDPLVLALNVTLTLAIGGILMVFALPSPPQRAFSFAAFWLAVFCLTSALLMILGWRSGLVPYIGEGNVPRVAPPAAPPGVLAVCLTGVVISGSNKERLRNRPASLTLGEGGLTMLRTDWGELYGLPASSRRSAAGRVAMTIHLAWTDIRGMNWGTIYLPLSDRPAIRIATGIGVHTIAFDWASQRDAVYAFIATRVRRDP